MLIFYAVRAIRPLDPYWLNQIKIWPLTIQAGKRMEQSALFEYRVYLTRINAVFWFWRLLLKFPIIIRVLLGNAGLRILQTALMKD